MNIRRVTLFSLGAMLIGLALAMPVRGQGGIIVNNADATTTVAVMGSSDLNTLIASVGPRFVVHYANGIQYHGVVPISSDLQTLLDQVDDRFVIRYANLNRVLAFAYPIGLVGDITPPQISQVTVITLSPTSVKVSWLTDEFAASSLAYGTQSGIYTSTITDPLYYKLHGITLTGLITGETYYYSLGNTDRSGNTFQSLEFNFTLQSIVYLPLIRR